MSATGTKQEVFEYLEDVYDAGTSYVKSKAVGENLDRSAKKVGAAMGAINDDYEQARDGRDDLDVQEHPEDLKWGYSSSTSWRIDPLFTDDAIYQYVAQAAGIDVDTEPTVTGSERFA